MEWLSYSAPLLEGAWVTIQLTVYSTILGAFFAFAFGLGKLSHSCLARSVSIAFIEVFRGTSLLVQLFWLYFALPILGQAIGVDLRLTPVIAGTLARSEEHTSELQSLMRRSYAVFCLKIKKQSATRNLLHTHQK